MTKVIAQGSVVGLRMCSCKREPGMFTPSENIIRLGSSLRQLLIQANAYPATRSCGRCCGESHTSRRKSPCSHV